MPEVNGTDYLVYHNGPELGHDLSVTQDGPALFEMSGRIRQSAERAIGQTVWIVCRLVQDGKRYLIGSYTPSELVERENGLIALVGKVNRLLEQPISLQEMDWYEDLRRASASFVGFRPLDETLALKFEELAAELDDGEKLPRGLRNPPWTRDELILALELYLRDPEGPPNKTSPEVAELSNRLRLIGNRLALGNGESFRNINGVYMKLMNFRRFDPKAASQGSVGLTRGNKDEVLVWEEFSARPDHLKAVASAIIAASIDESVSSNSLVDALADDFCDAPEGRLLTRMHVTRERNKEIVRKKKQQAVARYGHLECEVCQFDFATRYGELGGNFIEVHHLKPLHTLTGSTQTKLEDLALVCANCHRMIHSRKRWLELDELRALLRRD